MEKKYAVYSEGQSQYGVYEYSKLDGSTVWVTEVSARPGCPGNEWPDKVDLGEVVSFVRTVSKRQTSWE